MRVMKLAAHHTNWVTMCRPL